jgi:hypothetical protein
MPKRKRSLETTPEPTLPLFEPRFPSTEYDMILRTGQVHKQFGLGRNTMAGSLTQTQYFDS